MNGRRRSAFIPVARGLLQTTPATSFPPLPAMVALVQHVDRGPVAVHCTYLRPDGSGKADLPKRKQRVFFGPVAGAAVRLGTPRSGEWFAIPKQRRLRSCFRDRRRKGSRDLLSGENHFCLGPLPGAGDYGQADWGAANSPGGKRCYGASGEDNGTIVAPANQRSAPCHS